MVWFDKIIAKIKWCSFLTHSVGQFGSVMYVPVLYAAYTLTPGTANILKVVSSFTEKMTIENKCCKY